MNDILVAGISHALMSVKGSPLNHLCLADKSFHYIDKPLEGSMMFMLNLYNITVTDVWTMKLMVGHSAMGFNVQFGPSKE